MKLAPLKTALPAQSSSRKIHKRNFIPLKVCARLKPPSLAILYTLNNNKKKYLHEISLSSLLNTASSSDLYQKLSQSEPFYLDPRVVPRKQVVRVIERVISGGRGENERCNTAATAASSKVAQSLLKEEVQDELKSEQDVYEADFAEESLEKVNAGKEPDNEEVEEIQEELPEGYQRVFVEDLGEEVLMDPKGNLYDFNGNLLGQAASDDEEENGANNDDNYFESNEDGIELP
eukprot:TRINITY_DN2651_c0_g1_i11.p1 TRINITY_DN2651_c0_g1~~TRINITY_DN2651_c0_g1_i11.p1  ORF type:complete len:233 (-),score=82.54 TRINITY_DN2651_c0_g1_i11:118-816(-)